MINFIHHNGVKTKNTESKCNIETLY